MFISSYPKTLEEAQKCRYGTQSFKRGVDYNPSKCAYEVWEKSRWMNAYQCHRKNGYGIEKLYCKQHAKMITEFYQ